MRAFPHILLVCVATLTSYGQVTNVWQVGLDDGGWPFGDGGGPNTSFLQENGATNALPGSPITATDTSGASDNDYYFSGLYSTAIPSATTFYGPYAPIGLVSANEEGAERAFAGGDLDWRIHFNLPGTLTPGTFLTFTWEPLNLDDLNATNFDPRFGAEVYFNGVLVQNQVITRPGQLNTAVTTNPFSLASVNAVTGPGADNIVSLKGISYNGAPGGGNWMGFDYASLDSSPVPEPSTAMMLIFGAMGAVPFLRRRRS